MPGFSHPCREINRSHAAILLAFYRPFWIPRARRINEDYGRLGVVAGPSCWQIDSKEAFMKSESFVMKGILDRVATTEEIQNAVESFHNRIVNSANETPMEIPSDRGGYVRISAEEFELLYLIDELNRHEK
jgi:hypothetical protein